MMHDGLCQKEDIIGVDRSQRMYDKMIVMSRISCGDLIAKHGAKYGARRCTELIIASKESTNIGPPQNTNP